VRIDMGISLPGMICDWMEKGRKLLPESPASFKIFRPC
jgi:hypothetical protein